MIRTGSRETLETEDRQQSQEMGSEKTQGREGGWVPLWRFHPGIPSLCLCGRRGLEGENRGKQESGDQLQTSTECRKDTNRPAKYKLPPKSRLQAPNAFLRTQEPESPPFNPEPHRDYLPGDSPREGGRKGGVEESRILARLGGRDAWGSTGKTRLTASQSGRSCPWCRILAPQAAMGIPKTFLLVLLGIWLCLTGTHLP